jgi:hypothetical protein
MSHTDVKIIADSWYNRRDARITTYQLYLPRFLLAEINTHGVLAKSAASSRAIPVSKCIEQVRDTPFKPDSFGLNKKGMQASEQLTPEDQAQAEFIWDAAIADAARHAEQLSKLSVHKQHANRVIETYRYVYQVVTATEWDNFFKLRNHEDAQPEFRELAEMMQEAMQDSLPNHTPYHLPYVTDQDCLDVPDMNTLYKVSSARCARVSYKLHDGSVPNLFADLELYNSLANAGHMSPMDHPALADDIVTKFSGEQYWAEPGLQRRFWGWKPHRAIYELECGIKTRRDSYASVE